MKFPAIFPRGAAAGVLLSALALGACAQIPSHEIAHARDTIVRAEEDGALNLAPAPLQMAQEKLDKAKAASRAGEYAQARRLAGQAEVDADYASATARAEQAVKTASTVADTEMVVHKQSFDHRRVDYPAPK
jgi:uncharacterized protein DUF4398